MSKVLKTLYGPVSGLIIDGPSGALQGVSNALAALAGPVAYGLYVGAAAFESLQGTPKPEQTEGSVRRAIPTRVRAYGRLRLYGAWILYGHKDDGTPIDVWAFHDGPVGTVHQVFLNDDKVTFVGDTVQAMPDGRYKDDRVRAGYSLGAPTETAFATVTAEIPTIWTANHRGDGVVCGYLIKYLTPSKDFLSTYPNGDDVQMSLDADWSLVFDPRDGAQSASDPTTWAYSENSVLALLHYLLTQRSVDYTTRILPQLARLTAAADDCDDAQALAAGGTEARYRLSFAYKATDEPASIIAGILATFDGWMCENERGEIILYSGRYYEPTVGIGPAQIVSYRYQRFVAGEDAVNEITVQYVSAAHDFNTVDAQPWRDEDAISASGREPVSQPLGAQIPSYTQGRRLAKRKMARANAPHRGTVTTTYAGRVVLGERFINLRVEEAGALFYDGPAEIVSAERDMRTGGVTFEWVSVDPNVDAWNPATEDGYGAPVGTLPDIEPLDAPVITDADPEFADGGTNARVLLTVSAPDRDDLTWYLRWRVTSDALWNETTSSDIAAGASIGLLTPLLPVNVSIDLECAYGAGDGRVSPWSPLEVVSTSTSSLSAAQVINFHVTGGTGSATATWQNPTSANLASVRLFRNTVNTFGTATQVGSDRAAALGASDTVTDTTSAGTKYYWMATVTGSGVQGSPVASGAVTIS